MDNERDSPKSGDGRSATRDERTKKGTPAKIERSANGNRDTALATRSIHAGYRPDPGTGAAATPIVQSTSYEFVDADDAAARYALERDDYIYSRIANPTVDALETRLTELAGGTGAVATGSGMAALDAITLPLAGVGDNVVCSTDTYGGTTAYFRSTAARRGIEPRFVPTLDTDAYADAIDADTAFVHVETIGNPSLVTPDFEEISSIAHDHGVPLVVDNTFATPALCRPLEHGADIVWTSTTKWLHGHGTTLGGVLIDGGSFPWRDHAERYPELAGENPAYADVDFGRDFAEAPFAAAARFRSLRSLGNGQSPVDAWQTLQGLETLPLRMARHCENAAIVADYLADHDDVAWVAYPGLDSHETHDTAKRYLDDFGGMLAFGLASGDDASPSAFEAGKRFCESVELASFLANVGDAKTLVIHPASTTHGQLTPDERADAGVSEDLVRVSVGLEEPADLLADFERAIERATES
ncbi:O-acetylhomoserine/O-acetylserine sulfhydrylase [Halovivax asiaticus JCM 14624]|uniref:O-acetylhomoserine/O-acetylserine sulfhydrylase n=1 Tax=Halovivax asiaticus JCM 14624 TaxID=1227490 RepID=M0BMM1_9EURY|nr:aminotransferase class I/II-fold pyridoxal phosphate-dependent enzyme [Halovivax asiaticus]ELZ11528.1 O-acetylhomoserine/O-acetylserine sulfhydrylase [Halovivax asiaticus JCM 14624]